MTDKKKATGDYRLHLDEIRDLENRLVDLRRRFLEDASAELEQFIGENDAIPFLLALAKGRRFALPVAVVEEVIEMVATDASMEERMGLIGLLNYHGKLVPLFDLAEIAGLGKSVIDPDNVILICVLSNRFIGVMVSEATDVYMVEKKHIEIAEEVLPGAVRELGVVKLPDGIAGILDLWPTVLGITLDSGGLTTVGEDEIASHLAGDETSRGDEQS